MTITNGTNRLVTRERVVVVPNGVDVDGFPVLRRDPDLAARLGIGEDTTKDAGSDASCTTPVIHTRSGRNGASVRPTSCSSACPGPTGRPHCEQAQRTARSILINSAHASGWRIAEAYGAQARTVLLVRDPLVIAISRTFRKPDYRNLIATGEPDRQYLERNIEFVKRFFASAASASYDLCVRYEQMRHDQVDTLRAVCGAAGLRASGRELRRAAERHGLYSRTTNSYQGPRTTPPPELVDEAAGALQPERKAWGYAQ